VQLKKTIKSVHPALAMATATLLGNISPNAHAGENPPTWEIDTAVMSYEETGRVSALEPVVRLRKDKGNDEYFTMKFVVDVLSGASPNGAIPTSSAQTFSGPSGGTSYTTPANTVPLDPNFKDTRYAVSADWEQPVNRSTRSIYGVNISTETDYTSLGASATYNFDFNTRNTTLTTGLSFNADSVKPLGGRPVGLTYVPVSSVVGGGGEDEGSGEGGLGLSLDINKRVVDLLVGVTQVMSRRDLVQFNFNLGRESGYLTDPYKLLSVVDATGALIASPNSYIYEKRPENRTRMALYTRWSHQFSTDVLRLSYRYFRDDWGIHSNTMEMHYRFELGHRHFLEPHLRYYKQTAADFYHTSLQDTQLAGLDFASADYRLADMTTKTIGLKYGWLIGKQSELGIRVESIVQHATPSTVIGVQSTQELLPDVKAKIIQLNYSLQF